MTRRIAALLLAVVAATGLVLHPAAVTDVRAATPDLTIVADARYDVQPDQHRVRVTLDMSLANHLKDTATKRYYFDRAFLSVQPTASAFKLTWSGSGKPRASVSKKTAEYTLVQLDLGQRLYSGKTAKYRLVFDLVDKGGEARRDLRVSRSLAAFPVWGFATGETPGGSVRVVFPAGFHVEVQAGSMPPPTLNLDRTVTLATGTLAKPLDFFAYLVGDREAAYAETRRAATVAGRSVDLTIRGWVDDAAWSKRVGELVAGGLPLLAEEIGLDWRREGGLVVRETISRTTGGYAGLFDPSAGQIVVAYDAGDYVVLHEAAHAWFNGSLVSDRWANEAFASYYGLKVAPKLGISTNGDELTPELEKARIPLNAWGAVSTEDTKTEDYAYAATLVLARAIAERAGADALRAVWADAANRIGAYQPKSDGGASASAGVGTPETVEGPPDWRGLLDLLESRTGKSFDDLWRKWVARDADVPLLETRADARARYDAVVAAAGDWQLPRAVRDAMRAWQFEHAETLLTDASAVLEQKSAIAIAAAATGLTAPGTLRTAFESPDGFATASAEATAELEAIRRFEAAAAARPASPTLFQTAGLWGTTPEADLDRARSLFGSGDLVGAVSAAGVAAETWSTAEQVGQDRVLVLGALALAWLIGLLLLAFWLLRRRRRGRRQLALADAGSSAAVEPPSVEAADSYATLAASSDPTERVEVVEVGDSASRGAEPD